MHCAVAAGPALAQQSCAPTHPRPYDESLLLHSSAHTWLLHQLPAFMQVASQYCATEPQGPAKHSKKWTRCAVANMRYKGPRAVRSKQVMSAAADQLADRCCGIQLQHPSALLWLALSTVVAYLW